MRKEQLYRVIKDFIPPMFLKSLKRFPNRAALEAGSAINLIKNSDFDIAKCDTMGQSGVLALYRAYFVEHKYSFIASTNSPTIIDGGANIGISVNYWKCLYPLARVIAFEPDPSVFACLRNNTSTLRNVELHQSALWNEPGVNSFNAVGGEGGHLALVSPFLIFNNITVKTERLKDFLNIPINLLKLDVEGAEVDILLDCSDRLHMVENIFVEHHSFLGKSQRLKELLGVLEDAGFRLHIHIDTFSPQPFLYRKIYNGKDAWLNIYGFRENNNASFSR